MNKFVKELIRNIFKSFGLFIGLYSKNKIYGYELKKDIGILIKKSNPICFDVGANKGQTVQFLKDSLNTPTIHCFEPSSITFAALKNRNLGPKVHTYPIALGQTNGLKVFKNYENSELSSFLDLDRGSTAYNFGKVKEILTERVQMDTLDNFCQSNAIDTIDLLKIDTQGFDFEVLKGGEQLLTTKRVRHILIELNFSKIYLSQANPYEIINYLNSYGFELVDYYDKSRRKDGVLGWVNALFKLVES